MSTDDEGRTGGREEVPEGSREVFRKWLQFNTVQESVQFFEKREGGPSGVHRVNLAKMRMA